jgi:heme/copper-type cytochrome/quinol oxidase subunit 2
MITVLMTGILFMFLLAGAVDACPTCKQALAEGGNHANVVRGYFWSILFMMSMPFLILTGLGTYFYLQIRKAQQALSVPQVETAMALATDSLS